MAAPGTITKSKIVVLCLICILISSFITYSLASSPSTTFTLSSGVYPGAPSYTIYQVSGTYYAKDQNGYNEFSGTDASAVIQAALNGLTAGRTWKEKVIVIGNIAWGTVPLDLSACSYTILEFTGKITLPNAFFTTASKSIIFANSATDIEIYVNEIDFNGANQGAAGGVSYQLQGIYLLSCTRFKIGIKYASNGILPAIATDEQVVAIVIGYGILTDSKGEISFINVYNLQFAAIYLVNVANLDIHCGNLTNLDDAFYMTGCYNITVFGGKIEGCLDSGTDIQNSQAIFFIGTKSINNYYGTRGSITTTFSTAFGCSNGAEVYLVGCSLVVQNSSNGLNTHILIGGTPSTMQLTDCYLEGDGTINAYMTCASNTGILTFSNCRFKNVNSVNFAGSYAGLQVTYDGGSLLETGGAPPPYPLIGGNYPTHANDRLTIKNIRGYNPVGVIATPYPAATGYLWNYPQAQAHPTSAAVYTVDETPKTVIVGGGTISAIEINGLVTGLTSGVFHLDVRESIKVTWTVQPTINQVRCE